MQFSQKMIFWYPDLKKYKLELQMNYPVINKLIHLEDRLTKTLNGHSKSHAYRILFIFTEIGSSMGACAVILILTLFSGLDVLIFMAPLYILQLLVVEGVKKIFKRPRPHMLLSEHKNIFGVRTSSGSFPSGHASNAFTMAILISSFYGHNWLWGSILLIIAGGISVSRIYLGKHYVMDILGGILIGTVLTLLGVNILL
jgi:membrane-associated phospholipid phosphatase